MVESKEEMVGTGEAWAAYLQLLCLAWGQKLAHAAGDVFLKIL